MLEHAARSQHVLKQVVVLIRLAVRHGDTCSHADLIQLKAISIFSSKIDNSCSHDYCMFFSIASAASS